ncbi:MAG TPA: hypothetical protein VMJ10_00190 [Kofleriaceae bacterium]|nr:hypothetical protein [Kofleriaceae bacterium]
MLELLVLVKIYTRLAGERWIALFAAMVTLTAWSHTHVAFVYIQLAYGFGMCVWLVAFYQFATLAQDEPSRPWRYVAAATFVAVFTAQNPTRNLVCMLAPVLVGCAWPWRAFPMRRRCTLAAVAVVGWAVGYGVYMWLARVVTWSFPRGHVGFHIAPKQIAANLAMLGRGFLMLCAGGDGNIVWVIPGTLLLAGALALVCREAFASRASSTLRWISVVVLAQLGALLVPLLIGNVLDGPSAVRYAMPSLLATLGLAVVLAVRTVADAAASWWRRFSIGWLVVVPVAALVGASDVRPPSPQTYGWPDAAELRSVAGELARRGLTHGFADTFAANLLMLDTHGTALTCRFTINDVLVPQRWLVERSCYEAGRLPDRFFVVTYQNERDEKAIRATLPKELERFSVGDTYMVYVFRTEAASTAWLDLPIPDGDAATFPIRLPATHLQIRRAHVAVSADDLIATGEQGTLVYGPYVDLPKGHYTATWIGNGMESVGQITFHITSLVHDGPHRLLASVTRDAKDISRTRSELVRFSFDLKHAQRGVELQIESVGGARVSLHELVIDRTDLATH